MWRRRRRCGKSGGSSSKFGGSSGKLNGFLLAKRAGVFAREASKLSLAKRAGGGVVEVAREASGVCEGKKKNRDKP